MTIQVDRDGDEMVVVTDSPQGTYRYVFEKVAFEWVLREKYVDGDEVHVTEDTTISQAVRDAVKDNTDERLDMVTTNTDLLDAKRAFGGSTAK